MGQRRIMAARRKTVWLPVQCGEARAYRQTPVLPSENAEAYQAKVDGYKASVAPRNHIENDLAELAAMASWRIHRAARSEAARAEHALQTETAAAELADRQKSAALGNRLLFDRRGPIELYGMEEYDYQEPRTSWSDVADDPDAASKLVMDLEASLAGVGWLLEHWGELAEVIASGLCWTSEHKFTAIRLLGKQPVNAVSTPKVAQVFLACHAIEPRYEHPFQEIRSDMPAEHFEQYKIRLGMRNFAAITPADADAARAVLLGIVQEATERLRMLQDKHQRVAQNSKAQQPAIKYVDDTKAGGQIHRLMASSNRLVHQNLAAIEKLRRNEEEGWGKTRQERQRQKQAREGARHGDRLVVDDAGTVRSAGTYEGDVEAGLARYEAEFGRLACETTEWPPEIDRNDVRGVPDLRGRSRRSRRRLERKFLEMRVWGWGRRQERRRTRTFPYCLCRQWIRRISKTKLLKTSRGKSRGRRVAFPRS